MAAKQRTPPTGARRKQSAKNAGPRPRGRSTRENLGEFLRAQRRIAGLTLRQLADLTSVSNAYLSQIERGVHRPSIDVLRAVARGLNVSAETLLDQVGLFEDPPAARDGGSPGTEAAILADPRLTPTQRKTLIAVYRSYVSASDHGE